MTRELTMLEKVAAAIYEAMDLTDGLDTTAAETYARAAMAAMREPTKEMVLAWDDEKEACIDRDWSSDADGNREDYTIINSDLPAGVYRAMLEAAPKAPT